VSEIFVQDDNHHGGLDEPHHGSRAAGAVARTLGQTSVTRVVLTEVLSALPNQRLRPRLKVSGLEVPGIANNDIAYRRIEGHGPQTSKVGLAIGGPWRRGGEVLASRQQSGESPACGSGAIERVVKLGATTWTHLRKDYTEDQGAISSLYRGAPPD
jgi:hypothetical protein